MTMVVHDDNGYAVPGIAHLPGMGKTIAAHGTTITFKAVSADTRGAWSLIEYTASPHFAGPQLHCHQQTLEGFYILAATLTSQIDGRSSKAPAGTFVLVPASWSSTLKNWLVKRET